MRARLRENYRGRDTAHCEGRVHSILPPFANLNLPVLLITIRCADGLGYVEGIQFQDLQVKPANEVRARLSGLQRTEQAKQAFLRQIGQLVGTPAWVRPLSQ